MGRGFAGGAVDVVVVGGGFAGVMTASELMRRGVERVIVLEREAVPGFHGSGRNAAIARRIAEHPAVTALAARSLELTGALKADDGTPILRRTGGVLLGARDTLERLYANIPDTTPESRGLRADAHMVVGEELRARWPWLGAAADDGALVTSGCGVVDIHALLSTGLRTLGKNVVLKASLQAIRTDARGAIDGVVVDGETIATRRVVNAAGFRANQVAVLAGAKPFQFNPVRRHLFTTAPNDAVGRDAPWFWDVGRGWYLRPEGPGLLLCACDATPWPDAAPDDPPRDPAAREWAAARFTEALPALSNLRIHRDWAGLRILTPDHAFVIGPDPDVGGFFWVAGLGGHGMTTACGVGELAADFVLGNEVPPLFRAAFDPGRLRTH